MLRSLTFVAGAMVLCTIAVPESADAAVVLSVAEVQAAPGAPPVPPAPPAPAVPSIAPTPRTPRIAPLAQTLPVPPAPPAPATPPAPEAPPAPLPQPARALRVPVPPPPPGRPGQHINVQVDLTITESAGATPETTVVSVLAADASWGRVRSQGSARVDATPGSVPELNVDARPTVLSADALRLELTVEYVPLAAAGTASANPEASRPARLHQSLNVILKNGQSLQVSRAVDPTTKRTTTVEVKATRLP